MSQVLTRKIGGVRAKLASVTLSSALAAAAATLLVLLGLGMFIDWWLELSRILRVGLLAVYAIAAAYVVVRYAVMPLLYGPDDDELALMVERHQPAFRSRLISSIQLSRPEAVPVGCSTSLIRAMVAETEAMAGPVDFTGVVKSDRLVKNAAAAALALLLGLAAFIYTREVSAVLLQRVMLSNVDVPRNTRVTAVSHAKVIARGDDVRIAALARGIFPPDDKRTAVLSFDSRRRQEVELEFLGDAWSVDRDNVSEPFYYRILLDDRSSPWYAVNLAGVAPLDALVMPASASSTLPAGPAETVDCLSQTTTITRGESVTLAAVPHGEPPKRAVADIRYPDGRVEQKVLARGYPAFAADIRNVQESFDYVIRLNDGHGATFRVDSAARPAVSKIECLETFPTYIHRKPAGHLAGDLQILAGSTLRVKATASKSIRSATARLVGLDKDLPMTRAGDAAFEAEFAVPSERLQGFSIHLMDELGIESKDEALYRIDVKPDAPPKITISRPDRPEQLATARKSVEIAGSVSDDFGVSKVILHYQVDKLDAGKARSLEIPMDQQGSADIKLKYDWLLAKLQPVAPEGSTIEFWLEARDYNTVSAPDGVGHSFSDHFTIKVVSQAQLEPELRGRFNEAFGQIDNVAKDQQTLSDLLRDVLVGRPTTRPVKSPGSP